MDGEDGWVSTCPHVLTCSRLTCESLKESDFKRLRLLLLPVSLHLLLMRRSVCGLRRPWRRTSVLRPRGAFARGRGLDRSDLSALPPDALEEADLVFLVLQPASLLTSGAKGHNRLACDVIPRADVAVVVPDVLQPRAFPVSSGKCEVSNQQRV